MDSKQFHRRSWGIVLLMALILYGLGSALYEAQMIDGADYAAQSQRKISDTEIVEAARGEILDRYGRVLVSNQVVYQVTLNTSPMREARNDILLALIRTAQQAQLEWTDTLSISKTPPFHYTTESPFVSVSTDENGEVTRSLTRLGRLSVKMKWLSDDPTKTEGVVLPTAEQLLGKMCATFDLAGAGAVEPKGEQEVPALNIGDMDPADARAVAGVLYELYLRSKDIYYTPYIFTENVDIDFISQVKEQSLAGVNIQATTVRQYNTEYAAHLLGRVALMDGDEWTHYSALDQGYQLNDTVGKEGVEKAFESYLRGTAGKRTVERNTSGKVVNQTWLTEPSPGDNVVLTIDIDLQKKVEDTLVDYLPKLASKQVQGAACVVMDVNSGEVLASASYPTFNLARYGADYNENVQNQLRPLYNRAVLGTYPPGSTFKMVTAVAGLEEGNITPTTQIKDTGVYTYYTQNGPQCWIYRQYRTTHGLQNVTQAIKNSCNVFFYDVGRQLGIQQLQQYAAMFGLGEKTGIEIPENTGVMAGPEYTEAMGQTWYHGNTLSVAIGQESSQFSPLQLANYIATLVNGGTRYSTHLLKEVKSNDFSQVLYTYEPTALSSIDIAPKNLDAVKQGMLELTTSGSVARYFKDLDVKVGAKTGSAQVSVNSESNAVFVCFAPYDNPQVAISIVVEKGGGGSDLGGIAAEILRYYFSVEETREEILTENTLVR